MKKLNVTIEIPKGSNIKYEYDRKRDKIIVDRILRSGFVYPANYGFISEALDWDGDELDVLIYSGNETFEVGVEVEARLIGAMKMIDDGETDTKLIAVHSNDYRLEDIKTLDDIPKKWLSSVEKFFSTYKNWKYEGITVVPGFKDQEWAEKEYDECVQLMKKYGSMDKNKFIDKMMKEHPDKYTVE